MLCGQAISENLKLFGIASERLSGNVQSTDLVVQAKQLINLKIF